MNGLALCQFYTLKKRLTVCLKNTINNFIKITARRYRYLYQYVLVTYRQVPVCIVLYCTTNNKFMDCSLSLGGVNFIKINSKILSEK